MFFNEYPYRNITDLNLDYVLKHIAELLKVVKSLDGWIDTHEAEYKALKKLVDDLYSGKWSPKFIETLVSWYKDNIIDIIGEMVKQVFFGITDDGYFVAYIPESWKDIVFGTTGFDDFISGVDYGHLTLSY